MKLLHIILLLALCAILAPIFGAWVTHTGRTLVANSRLAAGSPVGRFVALAANVNDLNNIGNFYAQASNDAPSGVVLAANDANFDSAHLNDPLNEFIADTPDEDGLDVLLEQACPSVPVGRAFSYRKHDSAQDFQAAINDEDIREIGGDFPTIRPTGTQVEGRTHNKGFTVILDNDQGGEDQAVQQRWITNLRNRLLRTELFRVEALLEANDTALTPNWGGSNASADPDGNIMADIDLGGDDRGINSNTVLYGGSAWVKRFLSLGLGSNAARHQTRNLTPEQLRGLLMADRLMVANFRRQTAATTKGKIVGDKVFSYYTKAGATVNDASNIKRFVTPVQGGGAFRVYVEPVLKRTKITLEHYSLVALTSALGIRKTAPTFS